LLEPGPPPPPEEPEKLVSVWKGPEATIWSVAGDAELLPLEAWAKEHGVAIPENGVKKLAKLREQVEASGKPFKPRRPRKPRKQEVIQEQHPEVEAVVDVVRFCDDAGNLSQIGEVGPAPIGPTSPLKPRSTAQRDADLKMRLRHLAEHPCPVVRRGWEHVQQLRAEALAAA